jgi:hypothetical protein
MNDRIRKLAIKSGIDIRGHLTGDLILDEKPSVSDLKKFAELIIRECLGDLKDRIARRYQGSDKDRDIGYGMEIVYFDIVDKFGVE